MCCYLQILTITFGGFTNTLCVIIFILFVFFYTILMTVAEIQDVSGGIVNILGGSTDYLE
jgi:hypothetical protein